MASPSGYPEPGSIPELERLAAAVEEELAFWRRRSLTAEHELESLRSRTASYVSGDLAESRERIAELEDANAALEARIVAAREQVEQLRTRLRFVEEHAGEGLR